MNNNRKEEIIMATLKLASIKGLGAVSMNMIADSVGIKKPSLYNHFKSKEELVDEMYLFLRDKAQRETNTQVDFAIFENKSAYEILTCLVQNYILLSTEQNMHLFYKVIYSERAISSEAAKIMAVETEKMINATRKVFEFLKDKKLLRFRNVEISALSFALTIHSLVDYSLDKCFGGNEEMSINTKLINEYIADFCDEHKIRE